MILKSQILSSWFVGMNCTWYNSIRCVSILSVVISISFERACVCFVTCWMFSGVIASECSGFRHLENGRTFFRYGGLYVTFSCKPGFRLHGHRTSSCVSGQWARHPPLCVGQSLQPVNDWKQDYYLSVRQYVHTL